MLRLGERGGRAAYAAPVASESESELAGALRRVALFADVDEAALVALASMMRPRDFPAGGVLVRQGDGADSFAIVIEGSLTVTRSGDDGRVMWTHAVGPGAVVGEIALLSGSDRTATAVAATAVRLTTGDRDAFVEMLGLPGVGDRIRRAASRRLAEHAVPVRTVVKGGIEVWLRPVLPSDREELGEAIALLSARSRRLRFFTGASVPERVIDYLVDLDYVDHFAWVAGLEASGKGIGVVRVIRNANRPTTAELAVAVADDYQGLGVGSTLVGASAVSAEIAEIEVLEASVLRENGPMRALLDRLGAKWTVAEPGVVETAVAVSLARSLIPDALADQLRSVASATMAAAVPIRANAR